MATEAAWFPDPRPEATGFRWWDGTGWTSWLSDSGVGPPPHAESQDASDFERPVEPVPVTPLAVVLTVVALVLAVIGVGATVAAIDRPVAAGPPVAPPPAVGGDLVAFDPANRTALVAGMSVVLPEKPWSCDTLPRRIGSFASRGLACSVEVHHAYAPGKNTYANLVVGVLEPNLVGSDVRTTGDKTFAAIRKGLFSTQTTVAGYRSQPSPYGPRDKVTLFSGQVRYRVTGLPSRYDTIQILLTQLASGDYGLVFANVADDSSAASVSALRASLETIAVR